MANIRVIAKFLSITLLFLVSAIAVTAQEPDGDDAGPVNVVNAAQRQPRMLLALGLTQEQMQQIRRLNARQKPMMQGAQLDLANANKRLDEAIYADVLDEAVVKDRIKDVQLAQAEISRIRSLNELAIRKILTPEQLVRFREMRQRFEAARRQMNERRKANDATDRQRPMMRDPNMRRQQQNDPQKPQ